MPVILVINCGSSSFKYELYQMPERQSLGSGLVERIGEPAGRIIQHSGRGQLERSAQIADHREAFALMVQALCDPELGAIDSISRIDGVGHRVVHGGEYYADSVVIDAQVLEHIDELSALAPLHNPANLAGIRGAMAVLPNAPQVAVFDTSFHQTLPASAYLYALPRDLYERYKIRRYGFHGTSHRYVAGEAVRLLKRSPDNTNVISCHLGNGASITAIFHGKSIDTSMGFTPLEGLVMGTRSGDIDPAVLLFLMDQGYTSADLNKLLNKQSGLLGLSGISNDLRDLEAAAEAGNTNAIQALDAYAYRVRKYIGAFAANLVKVDALVFTGGIGVHGLRMRERICERLESIGIFINTERNRCVGCEPGIISQDYSPTSIVVMPTNEELQIAMDTWRLAFSG